MNNALKLLLMSTATIITCVIVCIAKDFAKKSTSLSNSFSEKLIEFNKELKDSELVQYDEIVVTGADVINIIKKQFCDINSNDSSELQIVVVNSKDPFTTHTYCNNTELKEIQNFSSEHYINPIHKYKGTVIRNVNDVITELKFMIQ